MTLRSCKFVAIVIIAAVVSGCATARPRKLAASTAGDRVSELQNEIRERDEQIAYLEEELEHHRTRDYRSHQKVGASSDQSSILRIPAVTPRELQSALKSAGYDPGPVDGRIGPKTKEAVIRFQRRNGLNADGVVGKKTWALLKNKAR